LALSDLPFYFHELGANFLRDILTETIVSNSLKFSTLGKALVATALALTVPHSLRAMKVDAPAMMSQTATNSILTAAGSSEAQAERCTLNASHQLCVAEIRQQIVIEDKTTVTHTSDILRQQQKKGGLLSDQDIQQIRAADRKETVRDAEFFAAGIPLILGGIMMAIDYEGTKRWIKSKTTPRQSYGDSHRPDPRNPSQDNELFL
jgi:hypothetical protein